MAASAVERITALLDSEDPERQVAAAIVLGELRAKGASAVKGLCRVVDEGGPRAQRHALEALAQIGPKKAVPHVLPQLTSRDAGVREAAVEALVKVGEAVVPQVEARLPEADATERKALDAVLARLGGKAAFTALLAGLQDADEQEAQAAAVALRAQVKDADGNLRRSYLAQLDKALQAQAKRDEPNPAAVRACLKILGFLESPKCAPTLQRYAASVEQPASVRQEALIALRFTLSGQKPDAKLVAALVSAATDDDRALAQTALMTLAGLELPDKTLAKLAPLLEHPDADRAKLVIDMLAHREGKDAAELLVQVVASGELRRAGLAADALEGRSEAAGALVKAVVVERDRDRSRLLGRTLQPFLTTLKAKQHEALLKAMTEPLAAGEPGWQVPLELAREAVPAKATKALTELFRKLERRKPPERATHVLRLLCRGEMASLELRYRLASRLLADSHLDTSPTARRSDEALREIERLVHSGFDVVKALTKDRSIDLERMYYVGFHLVEDGQPAGEELLEAVVKKGGRKKIAKAAKNKLALAGA